MSVTLPLVIGLVMPLYAVAAEPSKTLWAAEICQHFRSNEDGTSWTVIRPIFDNRFSLIPGMRLAVTDQSQQVAGMAQWVFENCWLLQSN